MNVKHIGYDGKVRRTFENVSSIYQHNGNDVVSVNRVAIYTSSTIKGVDPDRLLPTDYLSNYSYEFPLALIHLAPGESIEREDEPA